MKKKVFINAACLTAAMWSGFADIASAATIDLPIDYGNQGGMASQWGATDVFGQEITHPTFGDKVDAVSDQECGSSFWEDQIYTKIGGTEQDFRLSTSTVGLAHAHPSGHLRLIVCYRKKMEGSSSSSLMLATEYPLGTVRGSITVPVASNFVISQVLDYPSNAIYVGGQLPVPNFISLKFSGGDGVSVHSLKAQWIY